MKRICLTAGLMLALAGTTHAQTETAAAAACVVPVAPASFVPMAAPAMPKAPSCLNLKTRMSTCSKAVLNKYNDAVDMRNEGARQAIEHSNNYVDSLNQYTRSVNTYSNCELKRVNEAITALNPKD